MKLSDLVEAEGYRFVVHPQPWTLDVLGDPPNPKAARVLACRDEHGDVFIAATGDCMDYVYAASHEIAEHRHGFEHTAEMFCAQANLLARWLRVVAAG